MLFYTLAYTGNGLQDRNNFFASTWYHRLLFTPVSITTLIDTEDARFILNGISPIAKGDSKWRDALLVTVTVNSNIIQKEPETPSLTAFR